MEVETTWSGTEMSEIRTKERQSFLACVHEGACGCKWQVGHATDGGGMVEAQAAGKKGNSEEPAGGPAADRFFSDWRAAEHKENWYFPPDSDLEAVSIKFCSCEEKAYLPTITSCRDQ